MTTDSPPLRPYPPYHVEDRCRSCNCFLPSQNLFNFGNLPVSEFPLRPAPWADSHLCPVEVVMCTECSLVQLRHTAPQELMYSGHYWYRSGINEAMRHALSDVTQDIMNRVVLESDDWVLDIGSNDGTLLKTYPDHVTKVGCEPATNFIDEVYSDVFISDFWSAQAYENLKCKPAKVITAIGMLYDLPDPRTFVKYIAKCLAPDGLFVAQFMGLYQTLVNRDIGNFTHEHLEFYTLGTLAQIYDAAGLKIIDIEENLVNGGSYRVFAVHEELATKYPAFYVTSGSDKRLWQAYRQEVNLIDALQVRNELEGFKTLRDQLLTLLMEIQDASKTVWIYGASTKGNFIANYCGLSSALIKGAADRDPTKWDRYIGGTDIRISSEEDARQADPDYFLVFPYAFVPQFIEREEEWRSRGGKFIVPFPELEII